MRTIRSTALALAALTVAGSVAACSTSSSSSASGPVKVGMVYEKTGLLSAYADEYRRGFEIGLDYATDGSGKVNGHKIDVTWEDDADSATTAVTDFKSLTGDGNKIIGGSVDSSIATQLAPLAGQNQVLYVSGPAAADQVTGANRYTFRSGRQTYQDLEAAKEYVASAGRGQRIVLLAQDFAFGQSYADDAKKLFGSLGDKVEPVLVPLTTKNFTPTALQVKALHPSMIFLAWAGTTGAALSQAMVQQGDFDGPRVVTGLANTATYSFYGATGLKFDYISLYFYQAPHNAANDYLIAQTKKRFRTTPDLFDPDGFTAAEMIVHAIKSGSPSNVNSMIKALSGWKFLAPKGSEQVRAADHALLQPMYQGKLVRKGANVYLPELTSTVSNEDAAPPVAAHFGG